MLLQPTGLAHPYHWDAFGDSGWGGRLAPTTATPLATVGGAGRLADWRLAPTTATPLATVGGAASQAATTTSWNQQAVSAVSLLSVSQLCCWCRLREHDICACAGGGADDGAHHLDLDARAETSAGAGAGAEISTQACACSRGQVPFLQL